MSSFADSKNSTETSALPLADRLIDWAELGKLPDFLVRYGIRRLCRARLKDEYIDDPARQQQRFQTLIESLRSSPIAIETNTANEQHYEVPCEFYLAALGERLKYSCAYYPELDGAKSSHTNLNQAEEAMLSLYMSRAQLQDGQSILELGCGWGSLTLWMAERLPSARITAVSNSATQKAFIDAQCRSKGLSNVTVMTCDMNELTLAHAQFDRCISIEMFEHMRNYQQLLNRIAGWLDANGKLFIHIFAHRTLMYPFEVQNRDDWMSKYFFTGGLMPATDTLLHFQDDLRLDQRWLLNGKHYERTSNDWLANMDANRDQIEALFTQTYGADQAIRWVNRWRLFFLACAELFGLDDGRQWMVAHYLFDKR
ncbi:cyclopropane-fatty-acyl-phospholipid synthase [Arenicella chitinivorans]|uniref:Cyclopropane-fatty-acyl-phospholipid synthase n=1 Tax=Arenicella chitinivorans TaxID=1329800 RepID=A0A918RHW1_9GAMM|nr:class I SAM-dependent methyltransferase [Arenicella chitinivorans]GGZ97146.1 cyclopropane-fatty-acyl-phospholipid synthase [Arenicella chitinivorans]